MANKLFIFIFLLPLLSSAQKLANPLQQPSTKTSTEPILPMKGILVHTIIFQGETIPFITLTPVVCYSKRIFKNRREAVKWDRLKYNVKIV